MSRTFALIVLLALSAQLPAADPTQPPRQPLPAAPRAQPVLEPLRLQAILRSGGNARAVINGKSLRVGERVDGARLLAIDSRSVRVERQGRRITLHLLSPLFPGRTTP